MLACASRISAIISRIIESVAATTVIVGSFRVCFLVRRQEMPFDEAVTTIRRGEPDNWGNLFEELQAG